MMTWEEMFLAMKHAGMFKPFNSEGIKAGSFVIIPSGETCRLSHSFIPGNIGIVIRGEPVYATYALVVSNYCSSYLRSGKPYFGTQYLPPRFLEPVPTGLEEWCPFIGDECYDHTTGDTIRLQRQFP